MTYKVDLLDRVTLIKIKEIEVVNEPTIHEEINGSFTFEFEAHYTAKNDLTDNVIIAVDGKYFKIAKVVKSRNDSISLNVHCEHVSYELIVDYEIDEDMEFESDVRTMIERFLTGTRFRLVDCIETEIKYYTTKTLDIRKRLFEVANLFAGELVFDNYNVSLVQQRGSNKGLEIELGVNLIGVTEEKDFVENKTSYELDLLDLSNVAGYEMDFSNVEIGDTITIKDSVLGINTTERVLAIDYNPFKKALPTVTVGDYIRDLTEYLKPEPEEDETEEKGVKSFFKQFKVGGVDMLQLSSDAGNEVRDYLTNKFSLGVEVSAKYNTLKPELKGIVAEKADGVSGVLSVVQTKVNESGLMVTTITEIDTASQLSEVVIKDVEHITLVILDRSLSYYRENRENAEAAEVKAIGICVTFDDGDGVFLEKFNVGNLSMLGAENLDVTDSIIDFINGEFNLNEYLLGAINEIDEQLKGLEVVPTEEYLDWYLTLIHAYNYGDNENDWNFDTHDLPIEDYANFKVTNHTKDFLVVFISNEPYEDIMYETASENAYFKAFGGTFLMSEAPTNPDDLWVEQFDINETSVLTLPNLDASNVNWVDQRPSITAKYDTSETITEVKIKVKEEYINYAKYVNIYDGNGSSWGGYYDESFDENGNIIIPIDSDMQKFSFMIAIEHPEDWELDYRVYWVDVNTETEDGDTDGDKIYFEYGSCPLSDYMEIEFENGPYTEVRSITTGIEYRPNRAEPASVPLTASTPTPRDTALVPNITIIVSQEKDFWDGTITRLTATSSYPYMENVYVNFHAVCVKGNIPPRYVT